MARIFAAVLLAATLVTGVIWLLDRLRWQKLREARGETREPLLVEYSKSFFPILFVVFVLRSFIAEPFRIPSQSMLPTLERGDFILVNKYAYGLRMPVFDFELIEIGKPERGDVIVFKYPQDTSQDYIKRVVGLPGDRVGYYDKRLFVNGKPVGELEIGVELTPDGLPITRIEEDLAGVVHDIYKVNGRDNQLEGEITVPEGKYFVMGDNRDNSNDSRVWGFVPEENLAGKAFFIWMNWDWAAGESPDWGRIGTSIE